MTGDRKAPSLFVREPQFVDKPIFLIIWGVAPSGVRAAAPHSAPSHGEGVWG